MSASYHGRCPRWRLRADPATRSGRRSKTLMYDGAGPPFERAASTRDGIAVWMRNTPGCLVKEVLAEARPAGPSIADAVYVRMTRAVDMCW